MSVGNVKYSVDRAWESIWQQREGSVSYVGSILVPVLALIVKGVMHFCLGQQVPN
jgi:hypothetical protein